MQYSEFLSRYKSQSKWVYECVSPLYLEQIKRSKSWQAVSTLTRTLIVWSPKKTFKIWRGQKKKSFLKFCQIFSLALSTDFFVDALTSAANSLLIKTSKKKSRKKSEGFLTIFSEHRNAQNVQLQLSKTLECKFRIFRF